MRVREHVLILPGVQPDLRGVHRAVLLLTALGGASWTPRGDRSRNGTQGWRQAEGEFRHGRVLSRGVDDPPARVGA